MKIKVKRKNLIALSIIFIFLLVFVSCSRKSENSLSLNKSLNKSFVSDTAGQTNLAKIDRADYLIYTANIRGKVKSIDEFKDKILPFIKDESGYVSIIEQYNDNEVFITFRIPKEKFYIFIDKIKDFFISIDNEKIFVEDVSSQYIDLEARLNAKKEAEKRFLEILQKANSVKDIIEIQQALLQIREEIDSYQGNLNYLKNSIQYSTITIDAYTQRIKLVNSLIKGYNLFISFILFLVSLWPFLLLFVFVILIVVLYKRKKGKR